MTVPANKTAVFAQSPKTATAVVTAAVTGIDTDAPTNTVELFTVGAAGAILTKLTAMPRATATASSLLLFLSKDNGVTKKLIDSELMAAYTMAATTQAPKTTFGYNESAPERLAAGDKLYVGSQVALPAGIVFRANFSDY